MRRWIVLASVIAGVSLVAVGGWLLTDSKAPKGSGAPVLSFVTKGKLKNVPVPIVGQQLGATTGTWTRNPTRFVYQWYNCDSGGNNCVAITGQGSSCDNSGVGCPYTLIDTGSHSDADATMRVSVTAYNASGGTTQTSAQTGVVVAKPTNSALPTITGTTTQGVTLNAVKGTWAHTPTTYTYQWQRCDNGGNNCANISSATCTDTGGTLNNGCTYTLAAADVSNTIQVVETASNAAGNASVTSAVTGVVAASGGSTSNVAPTLSLAGTTISWAADTHATDFKGKAVGGSGTVTISRASGFPVAAYAYPQTSLSVTPHAAGDAIVVAVDGFGYGGAVSLPTSVSCTCASGGLTQVASTVDTANASPGPTWEAIWWGVVTSTGSQTVSVSPAPTSGQNSEIAVDDLVPSVAGATWAVDQASQRNNASGPMTYPSLTANYSNEAYFGFGVSGDSTISGGSTTGFNYFQTTNDNMLVLNTSVGQGTTQSPTNPESSWNDTAGVLLYATTPATITDPVCAGGGGSCTSWVPPSVPGQTITYSLASEGSGGEKWSTNTVQISWPAATGNNVAPVIGCAGLSNGTCPAGASVTLTWPADSNATDFKGAIAPDPRPHTIQPTYVDPVCTGGGGGCTSWTVPTDCGKTDYYGLASNGPAGEAWSNSEVSVAWPACGLVGKVRVSVDNATGFGATVPAQMKSAGVTYDHLDIGEGSNTSVLSTAISAGLTPLPVYTQGTGGNCDGLTTSQVTSDINTIAPTLKADGLHWLEFCNEAYKTLSASQYAALYNAAHAALATYNTNNQWQITLVANATTDYYEQQRTSCSNSCTWFGDLTSALPGGANEVDAFSLHPMPYTSLTTVDSTGYGWPMVQTLHTEAVNAGYTTQSWYLTQVGACLGGSACANPQTQSTVASWLTSILNEVRDTDTWVGYVNWLSSCDSTTAQYGLLANGNNGVCGADGTTDQRSAYASLNQWLGANGEGTGTGSTPPSSATSYSVSGNVIKTNTGANFFVHGVNRPSMEWSCGGQAVDGTGSSIPTSDWSTMKDTWGVNTVRIPLNQDFWLSGAANYCASYQSNVASVVSQARALGLVVILDLHWSDQGNLANTGAQQCMADNNSLTFWQQVANAYKGDPGVWFDLYNEPQNISWSVWQNGGSTCGFTAVGMQQMYNTVRNAGANNIVLLNGIQYSSHLDGVPQPGVTGSNWVYSIHPYSNNNGVSNANAWSNGDWDTRFGFLTTTYPVIAGEFGNVSGQGGGTCGPSTYTQGILDYFQQHGMGYTGWAWYAGGCTFPALITDAAGNPLTSDDGDKVKADLLAYANGTRQVVVPGGSSGTNVKPVLSCNGLSSGACAAGATQITWGADANATGFKGAVSQQPSSVSGRSTTYYTGITSPWTVPTDCGRTDYYGVASTGSAGDQWADNEVSITWPACAGGTSGSTLIGWQNYGQEISTEQNKMKLARIDTSFQNNDTPDANWAVGVPSLVNIPGTCPTCAYGSTVASINAQDWANAAVTYFQNSCHSSNTECPALEVLNEPCGNWFWTGGGDTQSEANAYAVLLKTTYITFHNTVGANSPAILGYYTCYKGKRDWGSMWWNNTAGTGAMSQYVDGLSDHAYGGRSAQGWSSAESALGDRSDMTSDHNDTGKPIWVPEVGWPTDCSGTCPTGTNETADSYQWNQQQQADNTYSFMTWAKTRGWVGGVTQFQVYDYNPNNWYGMICKGEGGLCADGTVKPAYAALTAAAQSTTCSTCSIPSNTSIPTVSGTTVHGNVLTAANGSWSPTPSSYTYEWQRCTGSGSTLTCNTISGATSSTYTSQTADVGYEIRVVVTGNNSGSGGSTGSSAASVITAAVT